MLVTADRFALLLQSLGLSPGLFKPVPSLLASPAIASNTINNTQAPNLSAVNDSNNLHPHDNVSSLLLNTVNGIQTLKQPEMSCHVDPYDAPNIDDPTFAPFDQTEANVFRYRQQQSVNLGSWFVQESWMVSSIFACASGKQISELDVASGWGSTTMARAVLERHWDTFINQSDFQYLASVGINTVRLPIGYWSLGPSFCENTPFAAVADVYQSSWPRIIRTINMAAESGIGVLIDLHGAVGSQNGQPHSGISDGATNLFDDPSNVQQTTAVLSFLMEQLCNVTNVVGIQILNEPQNVPELPDFYSRAISSMRQVSPAASAFPIYLHDGFDLQRFSDFIANRTDFVVQDHHSYFVFTPSDDEEPAADHTSDIEGAIASSLAKASAQQRRNLVVDEWSCALTADSLAHESDPDAARRDFCTGQMAVYANTTAGWAFWSYKKDGCADDPGWCFKSAVNNSLPASFYSYGQPPSTNPAQTESAATCVNMQLPSVADILASAQKYSGSPDGAWDTFAPVSKTFVADEWSSSETIVPAGFKRSSLPDQQHQTLSLENRDSYDSMDMTSTQRCTAKGYSDGFHTAKIFASYNNSRLGFMGQYIEDSMRALSPTVVAPGTEKSYRQGFMSGLQDGESIIVAALKPS